MFGAVKIMSVRCKVCNASKISNTEQKNYSINWECQTCGNVLDIDGNIATSV